MVPCYASIFARLYTNVKQILHPDWRSDTASPAIAANIVQVGVLCRISRFRKAILRTLLPEDFSASGAGDSRRKRCLPDAAPAPVVDHGRDDHDREHTQDDPYREHFASRMPV